VGRALWFYTGADPELIVATIESFPDERRPDLWAGIGLAASYTGAQSPQVVDKLAAAAGDYRRHVGQGAAFAAKARVLSGQVPSGSVQAIGILTGADPAVAAGWTDACLREAAADGSDTVATYQRWRGMVASAFVRYQGGGIH
jgi:hypothetical protein